MNLFLVDKSLRKNRDFLIDTVILSHGSSKICIDPDYGTTCSLNLICFKNWRNIFRTV